MGNLLILAAAFFFLRPRAPSAPDASLGWQGLPEWAKDEERALGGGAKTWLDPRFPGRGGYMPGQEGGYLRPDSPDAGARDRGRGFGGGGGGGGGYGGDASYGTGAGRSDNQANEREQNNYYDWLANLGMGDVLRENPRN